MTGFLSCCDGSTIQLPPFIDWKLIRTASVPCDSFQGSCILEGGIEKNLQNANRLVLEYNNQRCFTGVLDEYELSWNPNGSSLSISGRGLAALLLDNEAPGQDYQIATLADILRDHVSPYGIPLGKIENLPPVPGFSVETGSSEWQVLYSFARYHCGVQPRFDVYGNLILSSKNTGKSLQITDKTALTNILWREKRYGVYSQILVQDRGSLASQTVVHDEFSRRGGQCRKVLTMPGKSSFQTMRYSAQFQLDRSQEERFRLELTLPGCYFCEPGDSLSISLQKPPLHGTWTVLETQSICQQNGSYLKLILG